MAGTTVEPDADEHEAYERLRDLSRLLDDSIPIPGTDYRIGLDPLLGLLPVVGDLPTTGVAAYIVLEAARLGAPRETLARMLFNLVLDATVGSIPLVGDAFDAVWKANLRNVRLLESRVGEPGAAARDRRFLLAVGVVLVLVLLALSAMTLFALTWLVRTAGGL